MRKQEFLLPDNQIYMCGHSLGPLTLTSSLFIQNTIFDCHQTGVKNWNQNDWLELPITLGQKIALLIGAKDNEIVVCDSTVINLYKVIKSALAIQPGRNIILTTEDNFPADLYIAAGIAKVKVVRTEELYHHINEQVALVMLSHVNYRDAAILDIKAINDYCHHYGVLNVWDLSHSVGIVPLELEASKIDFAVACTYKYLSGGPGSPALIYVNTKYHSILKTPIQGWMGHQNPFEFSSEYSGYGVKQMLTGTPAVLNMKSLQGALALYDSALIKDIYQKGLVYHQKMKNALVNLGIEVAMPKMHGGHIGISHDYAYQISRALIDMGIICDYRSPRLIRLCMNPLYLTETDIDICIDSIILIIEQKMYLKPEFQQMETIMS
jgi:kynureninase